MQPLSDASAVLAAYHTSTNASHQPPPSSPSPPVHPPVGGQAVFLEILSKGLLHILYPSREIVQLNGHLDVVSCQLTVPNTKGLTAASHHLVRAANRLDLRTASTQQQTTCYQEKSPSHSMSERVSTCQCAHPQGDRKCVVLAVAAVRANHCELHCCFNSSRCVACVDSAAALSWQDPHLGNGHIHWCPRHLWQQALAGPAQIGDAGGSSQAVDGVESAADSSVVHISLQRQQNQLQQQTQTSAVHTSAAEAASCNGRGRCRLQDEGTVLHSMLPINL